ncbi:MAG: hypothetical protein Q4F25_01015, partial [Eubacteriales bacterium]|nr:hypothetical protein [Eubacteriales bacterium]
MTEGKFWELIQREGGSGRNPLSFLTGTYLKKRINTGLGRSASNLEDPIGETAFAAFSSGVFAQ